jgi:hypothetical protein
LLQSLISQIFEQYPELIPIILPLRWAKAYSRLLELDSESTADEDLWSLKQLMRVFISILRQKKIRLKLYFFIDRFEKFEGDQEDLSQMVKDFATAKRSGIKINFSSRTWPIFKQCFQGHPASRLQNLTSNGIETYIREKVHKNNTFRELASRERDSAAGLIHTTVERVEGVFLWVAIVVRSLLKGVTKCNSISDLWIHLRNLPRKLEPLYELLVSQIDFI